MIELRDGLAKQTNSRFSVFGHTWQTLMQGTYPDLISRIHLDLAGGGTEVAEPRIVQVIYTPRKIQPWARDPFVRLRF